MLTCSAQCITGTYQLYKACHVHKAQMQHVQWVARRVHKGQSQRRHDKDAGQ